MLPYSLSAQTEPGEVIPNSPDFGDVSVKLGTATSASELVVFDSEDLPLMRVQGNGLVGIGPSIPQDKLHVQNGRLSVTTGASFGLSIMSHATMRGGFIQTKASSDYNTAIAVLDTGIGIGTITPLFKLHVKPAHNSNIGLSGPASGIGAITFFNEGNTAPIEGRLIASALTVYTNGVERLRVNSAGKVGIGTTAPIEALDVTGNARFTGTVTGNNIQAHYQDLAEWVPSAEDLAPGSVVVLDPAVSNQVMASSAAYDTTVAGVVSVQPGIILGVGGESKEQIATTGRVKVRVDATAAPIRIGDLLVTSGKRGLAMRSSAIDVGGIAIHRPGTVIGKALEPLAGGEGEILVLLSLQ